MKQIIATATGQIILREEPLPARPGPGVLTRTKFSAISAGTEGTLIRVRREKADPGAGEWKPGYSNVGVVVETSAALEGFRPGDTVVCAGMGFASHAEHCFVPRNLAARCPAKVDLREAAFSTLGTVAIHGLRRGSIEVGETVAIIGLGMIGLLSVQVAKAAGTRVIAVDINQARLTLASRLGADVVISADAKNAVETVREVTEKRGVDLAVITAGTPSSAAPLVQGMEMTRHRGRVVVVGNVKCEFPRDIWYYRDLDLRIATSYGPGRYDPSYEEQGHDYPIGYVRWTEGRNLQEFVRLLEDGLVKVAPLITHEFSIEQAAEAYDLVLNKPGERLGVLLRY